MVRNDQATLRGQHILEIFDEMQATSHNLQLRFALTFREKLKAKKREWGANDRALRLLKDKAAELARKRQDTRNWRARKRAAAGGNTCSKRMERRVLRAIAEGRTDQDISNEMGFSLTLIAKLRSSNWSGK